jgi:hypothetical protein
MFLRRLLGAAAVLLVLGLVVTSAPAAPVPEAGPSALAVVPADAPIVLQVHGIERTKDRLLAMLKNALPDQHALIKTVVEGYLQNLPDGRQLKGLAKDAPIFVVFTELPDPAVAEPKVAVLVGVTKYEEFRDGVLRDDERKALKPNPAGYVTTTINDVQQIHFVDRGKEGWAVVTTDDKVAAAFTKAPPKGLDKKLSPDLAKKMFAADLAAYVDMAAINKKFGDDLKSLKEQAEQGIEQGANLDKNTQELAKKAIAPVFQAISDGESVLATIEFRPEGLNLALHGEVDAKSKTNDLLKDAKAGPVAEMDKLPAGMMVYNAMQIRPAILKDFGGLILGAVGAGEKNAKALQEALDMLVAANPKVLVGSTNVPPAGVTVSVYEDPKKAVAATQKMYEAMKGSGTFGLSPIKGEPVIKPNAEKYAGFELTSLSMEWDFDKLAEQQAANPAAANKEKFIEYMKSIIGEGQNIWFGTDGKVVLSVIAKDFTEAKKLIDDFQKGTKTVGAEPAFKEIRKQMPADTTLLALIDVPIYAETIMKAIKPVFDGMGLTLPPNFGTPAVKGQTAFMGFALTMQPQRGSVDLFISSQSVNEVYKMYIKGLLPGGQ